MRPASSIKSEPVEKVPLVKLETGVKEEAVAIPKTKSEPAAGAAVIVDEAQMRIAEEEYQSAIRGFSKLNFQAAIGCLERSINAYPTLKAYVLLIKNLKGDSYEERLVQRLDNLIKLLESMLVDVQPGEGSSRYYIKALIYLRKVDALTKWADRLASSLSPKHDKIAELRAAVVDARYDAERAFTEKRKADDLKKRSRSAAEEGCAVVENPEIAELTDLFRVQLNIPKESISASVSSSRGTVFRSVVSTSVVSTHEAVDAMIADSERDQRPIKKR